MSSRTGTRDGLRHLRVRTARAEGDFAQRAADAGGHINRRAGASAKTAQRESTRAERIVNRTSTAAAGALGHPRVTAEVAVAFDVDAVEPCLIEILASLHVESDCDGLRVTDRVTRGAAAAASAEVLHKLFARDEDPAAAVVAITVAVTVAILILRRGERGECCGKQNEENRHDSRCAVLARSGESGICHCTPLWPDIRRQPVHSGSPPIGALG